MRHLSNVRENLCLTFLVACVNLSAVILKGEISKRVHSLTTVLPFRYSPLLQHHSGYFVGLNSNMSGKVPLKAL